MALGGHPSPALHLDARSDDRHRRRILGRAGDTHRRRASRGCGCRTGEQQSGCGGSGEDHGASGDDGWNFEIVTQAVDANSSVSILASYGGVSREATLEVNAPGGPALATFSLDPTTVTLAAAAPSGGATVTLISSNTDMATVPASVTLPAGATSATFTVSTSQVTVEGSSAITASHGGVSRTVILSVRALAASDSVSINRAEYRADNRELEVRASSTSSSATLNVYVTATGEFIARLNNNGSGDYSARLSWPVNPQRITVRSSLGSSATATVQAR